LNAVQFHTMVKCIAPDVNTSAATSQGYAFFLNYPSYYRNPAGSPAQMPNVPTLLSQEQKVFDEFKVIKLDLSYFPLITEVSLQSSYTTASGNSGVTVVSAVWDHTTFVAVDWDDSSLFTTAPKAQNSQGSSMLSRVGRGMIHMISMPQTDPVDKLRWFNLGALSPSSPDPANIGKLASIKVYTGTGNGYPVANATMGFWVAQWFVRFKGVYTIT